MSYFGLALHGMEIQSSDHPLVRGTLGRSISHPRTPSRSVNIPTVIPMEQNEEVSLEEVCNSYCLVDPEQLLTVLQRLKSALWLSIGKIVDEETIKLGINATPQFIGALTEMVWAQIGMWIIPGRYRFNFFSFLKLTRDRDCKPRSGGLCQVRKPNPSPQWSLLVAGQIFSV